MGYCTIPFDFRQYGDRNLFDEKVWIRQFTGWGTRLYYGADFEYMPDIDIVFFNPKDNYKFLTVWSELRQTDFFNLFYFHGHFVNG